MIECYIYTLVSPFAISFFDFIFSLGVCVQSPLKRGNERRRKRRRNEQKGDTLNTREVWGRLYLTSSGSGDIEQCGMNILYKGK